MKTIKKSFFRFFDKIVVLLLGVAGMFTACDVLDKPDDPICMYGMPHADFELKGTVTNESTSRPIKNIRVIRPHFPEPEYENLPPEYKLAGDTVYTDEKGEYAFAYSDFRGSKYQLKFEDIDGTGNGGLFSSKEIKGKFTSADQVEKGKGWYEGKFTKTEDVKLKRMDIGPVPAYGVFPTTFQP